MATVPAAARRRSDALPTLVVGLVALIVTAILAHGRTTPYDNFVLLAQAWLHGRPWIDWPGAYIDALPYNGRYYVIEAPMPAVLLLPFVALLGNANQTLLAIVLAAFGTAAAFAFARRVGCSLANAGWIAGFFLLGTDLAWAAMLGDVWMIAHVAGAAFAMLTLAEVAGRRRGWLVALLAVCAFESRFSLVLAIPIYAYLVARDRPRAELRRELIAFAAVCAAGAVLWVAWNLARWGVPTDIGYTAWYHQDNAGSPTGSPFQLRYFWYQVTSFFVQLPTFRGTFPFVIPEMTGQALTWTSPAIVLAFFARGPRPLVLALWGLVVVTAAPNFIYYVNGFAQFGMRHALDFEPFLVALMAVAARERLRAVWKALIVYSGLVGLWGCWFWNTFYRNPM
jgi:hypothetical protein